MRPNLTGQPPNANKPADRRGKVLFINADAEFHAGRAQNYLRPEHVEKIVSTFDRYRDIPDYARVVPLTEIASEANDFNLNIRRYVDNSPPPEPPDVRALVLELFAQDVQAGLDAAVAEKRQELVRYIEGLWDKYRVTLTDLCCDRTKVERQLGEFLSIIDYA